MKCPIVESVCFFWNLILSLILTFTQYSLFFVSWKVEFDLIKLIGHKAEIQRLYKSLCSRHMMFYINTVHDD